MPKLRRFAGLAAALAVASLFLILRIADPPIVSELRAAGFDSLQRLWPRTGGSDQPVTIVDIDEASLRKLGQWPWRRDALAKLVTNLSNQNAAAIGFDILFPEPDRLSPKLLAKDLSLPPSTELPDTDQIFADAITGHHVVLAAAANPSGEVLNPFDKAGFASTGMPAISAPLRMVATVNNLPKFDAAAAGIGLINIDLASESGVARQIPLLWTDGQSFRPSLILETLRLAQNASTYVVNGSNGVEDAITSIRIGDFDIPVSEQGQLSVYYSHNSSDLYVSAADVLDDKKLVDLAPRIAGHIILIGTSATGLLDARTSSLGEAVPGVSVHAQALQQIMSGQFLTRPEWSAGAEFAAIILGGLVFGFGAALLRPWQTLVALVLAIALMASASLYAFRELGFLFDATFPITAFLGTFLAGTALRLFVTDREGRQLRRAFGHYVAPGVLAEIEKNPGMLKLGGEIRDVTVMFVDIANFTPMSQKLKPEELVHLINDILSACCTAILNHEGTIDKFIGDAVMAFWNAPIDQTDHQAKACRSALEIQQAIASMNASPRIQEKLNQAGLPPVAVRVGLASGEACVGNVGSATRFDYSVIGETVNTAARTESACKELGCNIALAGEPTRATASLNLMDMGELQLKGLAAPTRIWAVTSGAYPEDFSPMGGVNCRPISHGR
jgi:adenylate cyclase